MFKQCIKTNHCTVYPRQCACREFVAAVPGNKEYFANGCSGRLLCLQLLPREQPGIVKVPRKKNSGFPRRKPRTISRHYSRPALFRRASICSASSETLRGWTLTLSAPTRRDIDAAIKNLFLRADWKNDVLSKTVCAQLRVELDLVPFVKVAELEKRYRW